MPDLQTELIKALEEGKRQYLNATLTEWDKHEQEIRQPAQPQTDLKEKAMNAPTNPIFTPSGNNLSKDIFDYILVHSGLCTGVDVKNAMEAVGYNKVSVFSLITQMKRAKMIKEMDGKLRALLVRYKPVRRTYRKHNDVPNAPAKTARKPDTGIAALPAAATAPIIKTTWDASTIIDHLSLRQARELYNELAKVFGGK